jgi:cation transport ATPase
VLGIAALTFVVWMVVDPEPRLTYALVNAVAVLIIACPCAMGLATPAVIMNGTGRAAELGILFRKGEALQTLRDVTLIAFDKTGTLTRGKPELTDLVMAPPESRHGALRRSGMSQLGSFIAGPTVALSKIFGRRRNDRKAKPPTSIDVRVNPKALGFTSEICCDADASEILRLVTSVEAQSEHPVATALADAARVRGLPFAACSKFTATPGMGVAGKVDVNGADKLCMKAA